MTEAEAIALIVRAMGGHATTAEITVVIRALLRRHGDFTIDGRDIATGMKASGLFDLDRPDSLKPGIWRLRGEVSSAHIHTPYRGKMVHVEVERGKAGLLYATSPDVPGLFVGARTTLELMDEVREVLRTMEEAGGEAR